MDEFDLRNWPDFLSAGGSPDAPAIIDQLTIDSRRIASQRSLFVALKGEKEDGHDFLNQAMAAGAKYAIVSNQRSYPPNLTKLTLLKVSDPLRALQSFAKAYRTQLPTKILGITGSFGKTMVKDLLYSFLKTEKQISASPESFNSQIGVALSLLSIRKNDEFAIIEAAISHKNEMDYLVEMIQPNFSILTPFGKKHLATLEDIPTLFFELWKLVQATQEKGWTLIPYEAQFESFYKQLKTSSYFWNNSSTYLPHAISCESSPFSTYSLHFPDKTQFLGSIATGHAYFFNLINMAVKAAWLLGVSSENIKSILNTYQPEPTRTEIWKSNQGATIVNDTYCSDPQSIDHSLNYYDYSSPEQRKIFVFGGMRGESPYSQIDYQRIGKAIAKASIRHLLLVGGKSFHSLANEVSLHAPETEILAFDQYHETFNYLQSHLQFKDIVIFKGEKKLSLDLLVDKFNGSMSNNQCVINFAAIQTNLQLIKNRLPASTRLMVMVKALAYGTDEVRMGQFLAKCSIDILGVSYVDEGVALKQAGVSQAIFTINATPGEAAKVVKWNLEVGINDTIMIEKLAEEASSQGKRIKVHLHVNTGMSRFGCRPEEALLLAQKILSHPSLELEGILTHFACAENPEEDAFTKQQIDCFDQVIQELENNGIIIKWKHAANSSGAIRFNLPQYNMVRIGLAVYGLYSSEAVRKALDLKLALSLTSRIVAINHCRKGESISYGRRYKIDKDFQKIAVLPIGYFDGLHRNYSEKANVLIRGKKAPMVGNICMDYMMVDISDIPSACIGDKVLIFGEDEYGFYQSPEELAASGDSIIYELMTCLGPRISRIFVYEEGKQVR